MKKCRYDVCCVKKNIFTSLTMITTLEEKKERFRPVLSHHQGDKMTLTQIFL